jgi:hypothetical protein
VVCVDGRENNILSLRQRYPNLEGHVADVQDVPMSRFGMFDIVFSYGLLYHLEDPVRGLRNLASACEDMLLLETCICDSADPVSYLVDEPPSFNQTLAALGCRPSPAYVAMSLNRVGFPYVYGTVTRPLHPDFQFEWKNNLEFWRDGHLLRCIFVASRREIRNANLRNLLSPA